MFNPLSDQECAFLDLFGGKERPFYIIGTYGEKKSSLNHELAHGLFYTNEDYRAEVLEVIHDIPEEFKKVITDFLESSGGYHYSVIIDEIHAYLVDGLEKLGAKGLNLFPFLRFEKKLKIVFDNYLNKKS